MLLLHGGTYFILILSDSFYIISVCEATYTFRVSFSDTRFFSDVI